MQVLIKNPGSCVINGGKATPYFNLKKGTRQGDSVSAYLFVIVLEVVFSLIKSNPDIEGLQFFFIFSYNLLMQRTIHFF